MIGELLSPIKSLYLLVKEKWWYLLQRALPFGEGEGYLLNILVKYANWIFVLSFPMTSLHSFGLSLLQLGFSVLLVQAALKSLI